MPKINPPLPTADELRAIRNDTEAMRAAVRLREDLSQAVKQLRPEVLLVLVRQQFPDETHFQAVTKFGLEAIATRRTITALSEDMAALERADNERLAPVFNAAATRHMEIVGKLNGIPREIQCAEGTMRRKREELKALGVTDKAVVERLAPTPDYAAFSAKREALEAENACLVEFLKTKDESKLPHGFSVPVSRRPVPDAAPRLTGFAALAHKAVSAMQAVM